MTGAPEPTGTVEQALGHAGQLLERSPELAAQQATEILKVAPRDARALLLLGLAQGALGRGEAAVVALRRAVALQPDLPDAWRVLGDHLTVMGDNNGADIAYARHLKASTRDPRLLEPAVALCDNRIGVAEALLRAHLKQFPTDIAAIRMFAEVAARLGRYADAEALLARCLELAPSFTAARLHYAIVLHRQAKETAALAEVERLLAREPRQPVYLNLMAAVLSRVGEHARAITIYEEVLKQYPAQAKVWMSFGHALKTSGRQSDAVAAYQKSTALAPEFGEAYWSLANLKTFRFAPAEVDAMLAQLQRADISDDDRMHFHFSLGKALEDAGSYERSFEHYMAGNELRRKSADYDAEETAAHVRRSRALYTREFFAAHFGSGSPAPDPIFIVGLPRSGSTLLEQILASHSAVEGTTELPDITSIARELGGRRTRSEVSKYPEVLAQLSADALRELGERYLAGTRVHRKTDAAYFIDKMPNNFLHVGLIHLILPNARIIDARRHPLGCCFSGFKQHFARGQAFTYGIEEIGQYYRCYVELMAHFDAVLPGRVHRVYYERLVDDTPGEVRRLLEYCGLPFEETCLRFYENARAVRTASSEQVRTPIYREGLDQWRHFEPWLDPLKAALGPVLEAYPGVPEF